MEVWSSNARNLSTDLTDGADPQRVLERLLAANVPVERYEGPRAG
jgi:hypothetical protein